MPFVLTFTYSTEMRKLKVKEKRIDSSIPLEWMNKWHFTKIVEKILSNFSNGLSFFFTLSQAV